MAQLTDSANTVLPRNTPSDLIDLPGVNPAGRLDSDDEGLMLLIDNGVSEVRQFQRHFMTTSLIRSFLFNGLDGTEC